MGPVLQYDTAANAIAELKFQGYNVDFNLPGNVIAPMDQFEIKAIYRYEGDTDPADEIIIYAIESASGVKGTFLSGYGSTSEDPFSLMIRFKNAKQ
jgi:hypothetical protein